MQIPRALQAAFGGDYDIQKEASYLLRLGLSAYFLRGIIDYAVVSRSGPKEFAGIANASVGLADALMRAADVRPMPAPAPVPLPDVGRLSADYTTGPTVDYRVDGIRVMLGPRQQGEYTDRGFALARQFEWEVRRDEFGMDALIPVARRER